jgi:hypothetical protein
LTRCTVFRIVLRKMSRSTRKPTPKEQSFWDGMFRDSYNAALQKDGDVIKRSALGLIHAAEEAAWLALDARRRAANGERPS